MEKIHQLLGTLGASSKDRIVYLAVIKLGVSRAKEIAFETRLPRQTTFSILQKLLDKELIQQHDHRGIKRFSADPKQLLTLIEKQKATLDEFKQGVEQELPQLVTLRYRTTALPKVEYYEGKEGMKRLFQKILEQHKRGTKKFRGYGIGKFQGALDDRFLEQFLKKREQLGVTTHLFTGLGGDLDIGEQTKKYKRNIKRLDMPQQKAGCYIVGNTMYLFSYETKIGVAIEDKAMAELMAVVFDDHWSKTR